MRKPALQEMLWREIPCSIGEIVLRAELIEPTLQREAVQSVLVGHAVPVELVKPLELGEQQRRRISNTVQRLLAEAEVWNEALLKYLCDPEVLSGARRLGLYCKLGDLKAGSRIQVKRLKVFDDLAAQGEINIQTFLKKIARRILEKPKQGLNAEHARDRIARGQLGQAVLID